jgi:signal transduction histidine kinase
MQAGSVEERSAEHRRDQRRRLRPLGLVLIAVVAIPALTSSPQPGVRGEGLAVSIALVGWVVAGIALTRREPREPAPLRSSEAMLVAVLAASVVVLAFVQPGGAAELGLALVAFDASASLQHRAAIGLTVVTTLAVVVAVARNAAHVAASIAGVVVLSAVMFLVATLLRTSRERQARAEAMAAELAELQEVRAREAAGAERARIARDLHDVLAHTLSGLSLQLEATRLLAAKAGAGVELTSALERCSRLTREGLQEARGAVGALRGDTLPGVAQIADLVTEHATTTDMTVDQVVTGEPRPLGVEQGVALYRAAQEALVNVARHSRGSHVRVEIAYLPHLVRLVVEDSDPREDREPRLGDAGSGYGLTAMRERVVALGGTVDAGATPTGFRVAAEMPG